MFLLSESADSKKKTFLEELRMTQTSGQLAAISMEQLLRAIKALGRDAKLDPIKNKLNHGKRMNIDTFYTCADVDRVRTRALEEGYVVVQGRNHLLTKKGCELIGASFEEVKAPEEPAFA